MKQRFGINDICKDKNGNMVQCSSLKENQEQGKKQEKLKFEIERKRIKEWLDKHHIFKYMINDNLSINVEENIDLSYQKLKIIPIKFNKVFGNFDCI